MGSLRLSAALALGLLTTPSFAQEPAPTYDAPPQSAPAEGEQPAPPGLDSPPANEATVEKTENPAAVPHGPLAKQFYGSWLISLEGDFKREWEIMAMALKLTDDSLSKKERKAVDKQRKSLDLTDAELEVIAGIAMVAAMGSPEDIANFRAVIEGMSTASLDVTPDNLHFTFGPQSEDAAWTLVEESPDSLTIVTVEESDRGPKESQSTVRFPDADTFIITEQKDAGDATMTFKRTK